MEHNKCKLYGQTILGNLDNFNYGLTKKHQEELKKEYESIGKLAQEGYQNNEKLNTFTGYHELFQKNCNNKNTK